MSSEEDGFTPWEAKVACALLVARADGRYELAERDVLSVMVSPHEPDGRIPMGFVDKGLLVVEAILEDWGILLRDHLPSGPKETDPEKAPYEAYGEVLDRLENHDRPADLLEACSRALTDPADRQEALAVAYDISKADGGVDPEEQELFQTLVRVLDASKEEIEQARQTVDEVNAFERHVEDTLDDLDARRAPRLTALEATAGVAELAVHADEEADPDQHDAIEAFCRDREIPIHDFQKALRKAQTAREAAGPLGLVSACAEALDSPEKREEALSLARAIVEADDGVGDEESALLEILEGALAGAGGGA